MGRIIPYIMEIKNIPNHQPIYHHFRSLSSNGAAFFYSRPPPPLAAAGAAAALYIRPGTPRRIWQWMCCQNINGLLPKIWRIWLRIWLRMSTMKGGHLVHAGDVP